MSEPSKPKAKRKEPIGFRVKYDGGVPIMHPATASDAERVKPYLRGGDLVFCDFRKPRNYGFHRLAHAIGRMLVENIDGFDHLTPHEALKRVQMEAGAGCETIMVDINTVWSDVMKWIRDNMGDAYVQVLRLALEAIGIKSRQIPVHVPRSLSYESMDQGEFHEVVKTICKYVSRRYWPSLTPEAIEEMAEAMKGDLHP